jgi:hypothetical protein
MKGTARPRTRGRWVMVGVVVWLILATSITLEQGQDAAAQWGSALTLAVIGILIPLAAGPTAVTPLRGIKRMVVRRAARWFR